MHFDKPGPENTEQTLTLALARARELGIEEVVVASSKGVTAYRALELCQTEKLVVVTYHCGFRRPFEHSMTAEVRRDLQTKCSALVTASHALSGIERSVAQKHSGVYPVLMIADTLRLFGQGTKVAVEVTVMAADAGALSGKEVVAVGGTGHGADTALVLTPAHQNNFFDLRIRETVCKPRQF